MKGASEQSLARFLRQARRAAGLPGRVNLLVTSSREVRELNRRFRGIDRPTDVLSFPAPAESFDGDIAVSADIAADNARRLGHRAAEELKILALHGVLHLAGYDHERDNGAMARKEARLRRELGLPGSLIARACAPAGTPKAQRAAAAVKSTRRPR
jgi:probable rRNA maturation factor